MKEVYQAEVEDTGCPTCHHGVRYIVVNTHTGIALGVSFDSGEDAEELAGHMNEAYRFAIRETKRKATL